MNLRALSEFTNTAYLLSILLLLMISGCSSSNDTQLAAGTTSTASLGTSVKNVPLTTGVESKIVFTFTVPGDISAKGDASINVTKSLESITLSDAPIAKNTNRFDTLRLLAYALLKEAFAATEETAQVTAYLSFTGDPNVCSSPYKFGPYSITGMIGAALTSETTSISLTQPTVDIINSGSLEICVVTTPPINAFLTVENVAVDFAPCGVSTIDITGTWSGTFQCENFGTANDPAGSVVSLDISKNGDGSYHYFDGEADYDGHLCGNKFKFTGGLSGDYTESGTMIINNSSSATKTSRWNSVTGLIGGTCSDTLQKQL